MAWGKDPSQLDKVPSNGTRATFGQETHVPRREKKAGKRPLFIYEMKVSEDPQYPTTFRVMDGRYKYQAGDVDGNNAPVLTDVVKSFYSVTAHYHPGSKRTMICSGGPLRAYKMHRMPCPSCDIYWEDRAEADRKKTAGDRSDAPNRIGRQEQLVYSVWDFGIYYEVPRQDRAGNFMMGQDNNVLTSWVKADNPHDPKYAGRYRWRQGEMKSFPISMAWRDTLVNYNSTVIGRDCAACGTGKIQHGGWHCAHCGAFVFNQEQTTYTPEQRTNTINTRHYCQCGAHDFLTEVVACSNGCQDARRATVFDVDITAYKYKSGNSKAWQLHIIQSSTPYQLAAPVENGTPREDFKVLDLPKLYAPTSPQDQIEILSRVGSAYGAPPPTGQWAPPPR
jgi:hypothetical protein